MLLYEAEKKIKQRRTQLYYHQYSRINMDNMHEDYVLEGYYVYTEGLGVLFNL